jgi:hypothetical protein
VELISKGSYSAQQVILGEDLHHGVFGFFVMFGRFWGEGREGFLKEQGRDFGGMLSLLRLRGKHFSVKLLMFDFFFAALLVFFSRATGTGIVSSQFCHHTL